MENWTKGFASACVLCLSLFFWAISALYEYVIGTLNVMGVVIIVAIGLFFFGWGLILYRKIVSSMGMRQASVNLSIWLLLLLVVIPNLLMSLMLAGIHEIGAVFGVFFAVFAISASAYYAIPARLFGDGMFLTETVISPNGAGGIFVSVIFWTVVLVLIMSVLTVIVSFWKRKEP